jgi:hypothetical protein
MKTICLDFALSKQVIVRGASRAGGGRECASFAALPIGDDAMGAPLLELAEEHPLSTAS